MRILRTKYCKPSDLHFHGQTHRLEQAAACARALLQLHTLRHECSLARSIELAHSELAVTGKLAVWRRHKQRAACKFSLRPRRRRRQRSFSDRAETLHASTAPFSSTALVAAAAATASAYDSDHSTQSALNTSLACGGGGDDGGGFGFLTATTTTTQNAPPPPQPSASSIDVRKYSCVYCDIGFRSQGVLAKHLRSKSHVKSLMQNPRLPEDALLLVKEHAGQLALVDATDCESARRSLLGEYERRRRRRLFYFYNRCFFGFFSNPRSCMQQRLVGSYETRALPSFDLSSNVKTFFFLQLLRLYFGR